MYDYTHVQQRARDLHNYHSHVLAEIKAQAQSSERDQIMELLANMNDELAALEEYVAQGAKSNALKLAREQLAAAQAKISALAGE